MDSIKLPIFASEIIDVLECTSYIYINGGYNRAGFQHVIRIMRGGASPSARDTSLSAK